MQNPAMLPILLAIFALMLLLMAIMKRSSEARTELRSRLDRFGGNEPQQVKQQEEVEEQTRHRPHLLAQRLERIFKGKSVASRTAELLTQANVLLTVGELLAIRFIIAAALGAVAFLVLAAFVPVSGLFVAVAAGFFGFRLPDFYLKFRAKRRRKQFNAQLADAITMMANSLRAGYSLLQTMEMVSRESQEPVASEFRRVVRDVGLGVDYQEAMRGMLRRVPSADLDILVTAINIQHEVGGNLAQILITIGETIRERVRIKGEVAVLTSQARLSAYIISGMPFAVAGLIFVMSPDYVRPLFQPPWIVMPLAAVTMVTMGFLVMRKISSIEL